MCLRSVLLLLAFLLLLPLRLSIAVPGLTVHFDNHAFEASHAQRLSHISHCHHPNAGVTHTLKVDSANSFHLEKTNAANCDGDCGWCLAYPVPVASPSLVPPPAACLNASYVAFKSLFIPDQPQHPPR